jgi:asparagine synthase (glutamine-hydrolysing)
VSVQFGKCDFDGSPIDPQDLEKARPVLVEYGPDGEGYICQNNFAVLYRAFHTTSESRREQQPHVSQSGTVITWDGRLDNRKDLIERLRDELSLESTDVEIAAAAYERWGTGTFSDLIGDWALSVWNPRDQSLILANDIVGTRHLYYSVEEHQVTWCTVLDPLVLFSRRQFKLEEEYIAGWLSFFPSPHLTPYVGIHAVPPSSFVRLTRTTQSITKYWDFDPTKRIRYRTDGEYEEHFRAVFSQSVGRRLRSESPVLAELSGGMDSSSIVCVADDLGRYEPGIAERVETVSYYDDSEPNWNERPYFTKVEERRGRTGHHIAVTPQPLFDLQHTRDVLALTPNSLSEKDEAGQRLAEYIHSYGMRVVLSGTGGDEVTGGVPTPTPELADLLARCRFRTLARQLKFWALNKREPWIYVLGDVLRDFVPRLFPLSQGIVSTAWLTAAFTKRHGFALKGYDLRLKLFGALPSFQGNMRALDSLRRQLGCAMLPREPLCEKRYPYLDRDLLEFLFAVPREQIVRPGQRRSLMRRALVGIVPKEVLERRRKGYVARSPAMAISAEWHKIAELVQEMLVSSLCIVDGLAFCEALKQARDGGNTPIVLLMRTLQIEFWLRNLEGNGRLMGHSAPATSARVVDASERRLRSA